MKKNLSRQKLKQLALIVFLTLVNVLYTEKSKAQSWVPLDTVSNVECYYMTELCGGTEVILMKINNTTNDTVNVSYSIWQGGTVHFTIVPGNQEVIGGCFENSDLELREYFPPGLTLANIYTTITVTP